MQGNPAPSDKIVRFKDDQFLQFPRNRWALSHMRELVPTVNVWRGAGHRQDLGAPAPADELMIHDLVFEDLAGRKMRWGIPFPTRIPTDRGIASRTPGLRTLLRRAAP